MRSDLIAAQNCSIARAAAVIGDAWTILMIREAHGGATRYADFQQNTGAPPSTVSDRLKRLLEADILERYDYSEHPPRQAYQLTQKGRELLPILSALIKWGDTHLDEGHGAPTIYRHTTCGHDADPTVVCGNCREPISFGELAPEPGPGRHDPAAEPPTPR